MKKILIITLLALSTAFTVNAADNDPANVKDCSESFNRASFKFNQGLDKAILRPVAIGYRKLPNGLRTITSNFLNNLSNLVTIPNNALQGEIGKAGINLARLGINSTIGILGMFDVASSIGFEKYEKEDYGQTLGVMGAGPGCYLVLPILGPTTARDSIGLIADSFIDPFAHVTIRENELLSISGNTLDYFSVKGTSAVDFRANNISNFDSLEKNSIDLYSSLKSIYLQDRENKISNSTKGEDDWGNLDN